MENGRKLIGNQKKKKILKKIFAHIHLLTMDSQHQAATTIH